MSLSANFILSSAEQILAGANYRRVSSSLTAELATSSCRVFEDEYSIVAVLVFDTWQELSQRWTDAQTSLVELISKHYRASEAKAWEGYLVLLCAGDAASSSDEVSEIRHDTFRLRKIVAAGSDLMSIADVQRALVGLLPITKDLTQIPQPSVLDSLPSLLARHGIPAGEAETVVRAFKEQKPLVEELHAFQARP
jgi:hypothetical protein